MERLTAEYRADVAQAERTRRNAVVAAARARVAKRKRDAARAKVLRGQIAAARRELKTISAGE